MRAFVQRLFPTFLWFFPLAAFLVHGPANAQAGKSGLAFLKLGVSGRAVSMGDAMSAGVVGAASTHYNPAGLLTNGETTAEFLLMHKEWIQDVRSQFLGASFRLGDESAFGLSINTATVSEIQIRSRPGTSEGTFSSRDFAFGVSYAREISDDLQIGATAKYLFEKIFIDEATGFAFDLGAQFATPIENLRAGFMLANLGNMSALKAESITLPALIRVGPAYTLALEEMTSTAIIAADLLHIIPEKKAYVNIGAELLFDNIVAARVGYQLGSEGRGFSAGVGMQYDAFNVDYGFVPLSSNLGSGHTFSLGVRF